MSLLSVHNELLLRSFSSSVSFFLPHKMKDLFVLEKHEGTSKASVAIISIHSEEVGLALSRAVVLGA